MDINPNKLNTIKNPFKKILFLGYDQKETRLIDILINNKCEVWHSKNKIALSNDYDCIISFGYRHILSKTIIENACTPIINLHISYLPWNRGAHPNFWSFYDNTPVGVTIHLIDEGVDTGPIIFQKYVSIKSNNLTFKVSHKKLLEEVENLFIENMTKLITKNFVSRPQTSHGTFHSISDLPIDFRGWDSSINEEIFRLRRHIKKEK